MSSFIQSKKALILAALHKQEDQEEEEDEKSHPLRFKIEQHQSKQTRKLATSKDLSFRPVVDRLLAKWGLDDGKTFTNKARKEVFSQAAEIYGGESYAEINGLLREVSSHHEFLHPKLKLNLRDHHVMIARTIVLSYLTLKSSFPFAVRVYRGTPLFNEKPDRKQELKLMTTFTNRMSFHKPIAQLRPDVEPQRLWAAFLRLEKATTHVMKKDALHALGLFFLGNEKERTTRALKAYAEVWKKTNKTDVPRVLPERELRVQQRGAIIHTPHFFSTSLLFDEALNFAPPAYREAYRRFSISPERNYKTRSADRNFSPHRQKAKGSPFTDRSPKSPNKSPNTKPIKLRQCCVYAIDIPAHTPVYFHGGPEEEFILPPCTNFEVVKPASRDNFEVGLKVRALNKGLAVSTRFEEFAAAAYIYLLLSDNHDTVKRMEQRNKLETWLLNEGKRVLFSYVLPCKQQRLRASPL